MNSFHKLFIGVNRVGNGEHIFPLLLSQYSHHSLDVVRVIGFVDEIRVSVASKRCG